MEEEETEVIKGKKYHIDSTNTGGRQSDYAFRVSPGITWALMYSISERINQGEVENITVNKNIVTFSREEIFKIIKPTWEEDDSRSNSGRTHFKGTFDLYLSENNFEKIS